MCGVCYNKYVARGCLVVLEYVWVALLRKPYGVRHVYNYQRVDIGEYHLCGLCVHGVLRHENVLSTMQVESRGQGEGYRSWLIRVAENQVLSIFLIDSRIPVHVTHIDVDSTWPRRAPKHPIRHAEPASHPNMLLTT